MKKIVIFTMFLLSGTFLFAQHSVDAQQNTQPYKLP
jgi:hypothetical protein